MSASGKKDLSLAQSVGELNKKAQLTDKITKYANPKPWLSSAEKVFKKAEHSDVMRDEENAYVLYMRFLYIIQEAKKTTKYQQDQKYYGSLVTRKTQLKALERAEKLSASLEERYKKLELETKKALEKEKKAAEEQANADKQLKNVNGTSISMKEIDDLLSGKKPSTQTSADVFKKLHVDHALILSPNDNSTGTKDVDPFAPKVSPPKTNLSPAVDPVSLYKLLSDVNTKDDILILDTRSKKDFELSHLNYACCINIPDDLLKTSVHVGSIERKLPKSTWDKWITRGEKGHLVILDQDMRYEDITPDSKVQCLKDAIYLYDSSCNLRSEPLVLDGGFEAWLWHYPSLVTNPMLPKKTPPTKAQPDFNLDYLSYPDLPASPEKPKPPLPTTNIPSSSSSVNEQRHQVPLHPSPKQNTIHDSQVPNNFNQSSNQNGLMPQNIPNSNGPNPNIVHQPSPNGNFNPNTYPPKPPLTYTNPSTSQDATTKSTTPQTPSKVDTGRTLNHPPPSLNNPASSQGYPPPIQHPPSSLNNTVSSQGHPPSINNPPSSLSNPATSPNLAPSQSPFAAMNHSSSTPNLPPAALNHSPPSLNVPPSFQYSPPVSQSSPTVPRTQPTVPRTQPTVPTIPTPTTQLNVTNHGRVSGLKPSAHQPHPSTPGGPPVSNGTTTGYHGNRDTPTVPSRPTSRDPGLPSNNTTPVTSPTTITTPPGLGTNQPKNSQPSNPPPEAPRGNTTTSHTNSHATNPPTPDNRATGVSMATPTPPPPVVPQQTKDLPTKPLPPSSANPPSSTNLPPTPNKQIPPVPSPQPFIRNVPQKFPSSRTGMTHGLPPGWERVLDHRTGRYYFRDHNTKTTHWNVPASLAKSINQNIMGQNATANEAEEKKPSLKRSLSSPNLAKLDSLEKSDTITSERTNRPAVNRRTKPLSDNQLLSLAPAHGGQGKALTGFRNLGNSCYMNSILQCLIATAPLIKYILNSYYVDDINKTNPLGTGGRIAEELAVLTRVAHSGSYRCVSAVDFKRTIGRFAPQFGGHQQQDSQEFLLFLLDQFHEDTNKVLKKAYIEEKSNDGLPDNVAAKVAWDNHKTRNQSIIVELLQGLFKSTLTCDVCHKQSVTFDAFMSLTLPIPTNGSCQIEDCIRLFTTKEKVSKDNKWFCPRCKQHREAWKTMEIWKLPPILIVHFNRFKRDYDGSWLEKRQNHVNFPLNNFDMSKCVLGPKKSLRYNLYGVSNHYGSMQSGHYTAFCKNIYDRKWYKFDDDIVSHMSESSTKSSAAYILCYTSIEFSKP